MSAPVPAPVPEADVVLSDGGTALLRGIGPDDADRLVAFYARVSDESKYLRFFAPYPRLSDADVHHFTEVDFVDRVALIVLIGEEMVAVGRYDVLTPGVAEMAFLVEDAHHNRGLASVLLEHLAQYAREHGVHRFVAEVLPGNHRMLRTLAAAGYTVTDTVDDGIVTLSLEIEPTDSSADVMAQREHRAESRSVQRLLRPASVAVIGASRFADKAGQALLRSLLLGGYTGPVYPVNPAAGTSVAGLTAYPDLGAVPGPVDLAVVAVPVDSVPAVLADCARKGVKGLVVVSVTGPGDDVDGAGAVAAERHLVRLARRHGLRLIGPNAFGAINTDPAVRLNASLAEVAPRRSTVGVYSQSGALGPVLLGALAARDLGVSAFVAAGHRGDVSANDMLQYFGDDADTDVVLLYLESVGNPRKFARIARALSRSRPVVALRSGRTSGLARADDELGDDGVVAPDAEHRVPPAAADALFERSGVVLVDSVAELAELASLLVLQPLPAGDRVAIVGNSGALQLLALDQLHRRGLRAVRPHEAVSPAPDLATFERRLREALDSDDTDAVLVVLAPGQGIDLQAAALSVSWLSTASTTSVLACFTGRDRSPEALYRRRPDGTPDRGSVPWFPSVEPAVAALGRAVDHRRWRDQDPGTVHHIEGIDPSGARADVEQAVTAAAGEVVLDQERARTLLARYGIACWPAVPVGTEDEAVSVLEDLGGEVVLKSSNPVMKQRPDLADVRRGITSAERMRSAWRSLTADLLTESGPLAVGTGSRELDLVVQRTAPRGVPLVLRLRQDATYGPVVSFGLAGLATDLLGDESYRVPPLSDAEAARMLREIAAAPLLFGEHGGERVDTAAVEDLLQRLARLAEDLPEAAFVELGPVLAGSAGAAVLGCRVRLDPAAAGGSSDLTVRRLGLL